MERGRFYPWAVVIEPVPHAFTVEEYEAMGRAGVFPEGKRLELLGGKIVEMTPIGSPHASTVNRLNRWLVERSGRPGRGRSAEPGRVERPQRAPT